MSMHFPQISEETAVARKFSYYNASQNWLQSDKYVFWHYLDEAADY